MIKIVFTLITLLLGLFLIPASAVTVLKDSIVDARDISKVLNYLSYSLDDKQFGANPAERYQNATVKLFKKQPGLKKYISSLE